MTDREVMELCVGDKVMASPGFQQWVEAVVVMVEGCKALLRFPNGVEAWRGSRTIRNHPSQSSKRCHRCEKLLPLEEFYRHRNGLRSTCIACVIETTTRDQLRRKGARS